MRIISDIHPPTPHQYASESVVYIPLTVVKTLVEEVGVQIADSAAEDVEKEVEEI